MLREAVGKEFSDPAKVAKAAVGIAGREDAPVRLLLGTDAVQYAAAAEAAQAESDKKWRDVALSVARDA